MKVKFFNLFSAGIMLIGCSQKNIQAHPGRPCPAPPPLGIPPEAACRGRCGNSRYCNEDHNFRSFFS